MQKFFDIGPPEKKVIKKTIKPPPPVKYKKETKKNNFGCFLFIIVILLTIIFGFSIINNNRNYNVENLDANNMEQIDNLIAQKSSEPIPTQTNEINNNSSNTNPQTSTEPQEEPTISNEISITILNGARIPGVANDAKTILENNGIIINEISNTQNLYTQSIIYYTKKNLSKAAEIKQILTSYNPILTEDSIFSDDNTIVIVIGTNQ